VRYTTNGSGHAVEVPAPCGCKKPRPTAKPKRTPKWRAGIDDARRLAHICQRCDEPVVGKPGVALYCDVHRKVARSEAMARHLQKVGDKHWKAYQARNREKVAERARASYQNNAAERERRNAYKRNWRKLNRDKVRAQKERAALKHFRELPEWQKRYREEIRLGQRKRKHVRTNQAGERLCLTKYCRSVMHGREKKCAKCKAAEARAAREALAGARKRAA
jgi:hypothetical protein